RVDGMGIGDERKGTIPAAEAFPETSLPTREIPRSEFPKGEAIAKGREFQAKGPTGQPVTFRVVDVAGDKVTVRFLPPLFGNDLVSRVKVLMTAGPAGPRREAVAPPPPPAEAIEEPDQG